MPFSRSATVSETPWPKSTEPRLVPNDPPCTVSSRVGVHSASLVTRLMTPPPVPRPKMSAFAPLSPSTRSTLYRSRKYCTSSRTPLTKKVEVELLPRMVGWSRLPSPWPMVTPGT